MERYTELGFSSHDAEMLFDAENAVTKAELWSWLKTSDLDILRDVMFDKISDQMTYKGHSGSSFGWTMVNMKSMATLGWETWANNARQKLRTFR